MNVKLQETNYKNFGKCLRVFNQEVELYVTLDMGPRIIKYSFLEEENQFCDDIPSTMEVFSEQWHLAGGHRLWHSPEENPRTYIPDNKQVKWINSANGVVLESGVESWTQIKKEIEINLSESGSNVKVTHRLINKNAWTIELSAWALTVMASGGIEIIPQPKRDTGLLPNRVLSLWPYSKMNDSRVYFGDKYIILKHNKDIKEAFKLGLSNQEGWAAYFNHNNLFIKKFNHHKEKKYPDFGVSYETYTNEFMTEMETLSPITNLQPNETLTHVERWELVKDVSFPGFNEEKLDEIVNREIRY
ncbi:hypothetical protein BD780_000299 [Clostridium tetanomorphum]|uniref:DUF4380 domain-containing protein n=1 Tax=Clostridium tetanomorphum TaxID=1553 RepID=A0A923EAE1_CLOTT|nr:hypothetical protein [Clostridium tetanomorphum]KAJ49466.1 hypothetical protein CTM_22957 [Clostridium tetanomorphum DSM 665]KAJ52928.1 hypothetical protein CTM_04723 [Clostridium tetanomorphum DSM 665]MBC2398182.1 hypothetical protein [Clostridium tetanomorphum]MBP1864868.1 hypothetical protein [Clostridium tetanomorphum]NRS83074.1 hypothetical protein [Clostridium tetanomorphum]